jgi:dCTP deaminase
LINVSGFHVDPGYYGRLIFSVYNAGSQPARLNRQQAVFLLWMADLDQETASAKPDVPEPRNNVISEDLVAKVDRPIHSLQAISNKIERLSQEVNLIKEVAKAMGVVAGIIVGVATFLVAAWALQPSANQPDKPLILEKMK